MAAQLRLALPIEVVLSMSCIAFRGCAEHELHALRGCGEHGLHGTCIPLLYVSEPAGSAQIWYDLPVYCLKHAGIRRLRGIIVCAARRRFHLSGPACLPLPDYAIFHMYMYRSEFGGGEPVYPVGDKRY
jgi:hypothetical protein